MFNRKDSLEKPVNVDGRRTGREAEIFALSVFLVYAPFLCHVIVTAQECEFEML